MSKSNARSAFGVDANRPSLQRDSCAWRGCSKPRFLDTPICPAHAIATAQRVRDMISLDPEPPVPDEKPARQQFVYYLMIGPHTVKIGTTRNLPLRLNALRTEVQYIVAIERGGQPLEVQRHKQFANERIGRRENFHLSDQLRQHIESLQSERDEVVAIASETNPDSPGRHHA